MELHFELLTDGVQRLTDTLEDVLRVNWSDHHVRQISHTFRGLADTSNRILELGELQTAATLCL